MNFQIKFFLIISLFFFACGKLILFSDQIKNGKTVPLKHTPFSTDSNPKFKWSGTPENTKSFAFTVEDPDAPRGTWVHWLVKNIPIDVKEIKEGVAPGEEITNSWGLTRYKGPQPPKGKTHHYHFILYDLDVDEIKAESVEDFNNEIAGHVIEKAEIVGLFDYKNGNRKMRR